jgi:hypothetical protein
MTLARAALASFLVAAGVSTPSCGGDNMPAGIVSTDGGAPDNTAPDVVNSEGTAPDSAANDSTANDSTANDSAANDSAANDSAANDSSAIDSAASADGLADADGAGSLDATDAEASPGLDGPIDLDASPDGGDAHTRVVACNPMGRFGPPMRADDLSSAGYESSACLSEGGLEVTFVSDRADAGSGQYGVYLAKRSAVDQPWGTPTRATVFDSLTNNAVTVSDDGLTMFLERGSPTRLWIAQRATTSAAWNAPQTWSQSIDGDRTPFLLSDGSALYLLRGGAIQRAARTSPGTYGLPMALAWVSAPRMPIQPAVTADELTLYLGDRPPAAGPYDIYVARRANVGDPWGAPALVTEVSSPYADWPTWISPDGCLLYFASNGTFHDAGSSSFDIWFALRGP